MTDAAITYERWMPVCGWEGIYDVSNLGRVRTVARDVRTVRGVRRLPSIILATAIGGRAENYLRVRLSAGHRGHPYVHRLVCEAFHGPAPSPDAVVRHLNDVGTDNRADNLAWGSPADNRRDAERAAAYRGVTAEAEAECPVLPGGF